MKNMPIALLATVLLLAGCEPEDLRKDTSYTFYLDPDGAATWMVLEKDIHSVAQDPKARREGEETLLSARRSGEYDIARGLALLDPLWMETRVLREERPYMVATEARYASIDQVVQWFMDYAEVAVTAELRTDGDQARLLIMCDLDAPEQSEQAETPGVNQGALLALVGDAEDYRLVLTEGEFTDARGFRIEERGSVAILLEQSEEEIEKIEEVDENGGTVVYSLTWERPHQEEVPGTRDGSGVPSAPRADGVTPESP